MDPQRMESLVGNVLHDLGGAFSIPLVMIGDHFDLYQTIRDKGSVTASELASISGVYERYITEWLSAQAASGYIEYDETNNCFSMSDEQAAIFADRNSPYYMAPAFTSALSFAMNYEQVRDDFKTGNGVSWGAKNECLACATAKFFRPGYSNHLVQEWIPSMDGMVERLEQGIKVADIGCGHGLSTMYMAKAFPNSEFIGFDFHAPSIEQANAHAKEHNLPNLKYEVVLAKTFPGKFDFVTIFDCLHDMGDPAGAMAHVKDSLNEGGMCMVVEPFANDTLKENMNPVGRLFYSASTFVCVPTSLAQEEKTALGAQAGPKRLKETIVDKGGFSSFRIATQTPFNLIIEAKP